MKRYFAFTAIILSSMLFVATGCNKAPADKTGDDVVEFVEKGDADKGEKGKFEMVGDVPPAPGDEEVAQKQEQEEPAQKQEQEEPEQKQSQKQM